MSFAYKKLKPQDQQTTPYVANKLYDIPSSSYEDYGIKVYTGEYIPTDTFPFDAINDNKDVDGNYRRLIFDSINHLYYHNYTTESSDLLKYPKNTNIFFGTSSYDNYIQSTIASGSFKDAPIRSLPYFTSSFTLYDSGSAIYDESRFFAENNSKLRVISIPQDVYGNGIQPKSFELSSSQYIIKDDGEGNLWDYENLNVRYNGDEYNDLTDGYFDSGSRVHVGNVFYSHGIAVITNIDYLCVVETNPVARNDYSIFLNTQESKVINILQNDFDDCLTINPSSIQLITDPTSSFPDVTVSASGDLVITPNLSGSIPGKYKIDYSIKNNLDIVSNTASVFLTLTQLPLTASVNSLTQSCFGSNNSASLTFSIDQGIPPYSYSFNATDELTNPTPVTNLYQPLITASLFPTKSLILTITDGVNNTYTHSFDSSFEPISARIFTSEVSYNASSDGKIIISASGETPISASLTASFSNSIQLPGTFSNLPQEGYTVYLKDSGNCTSESIATVEKIKYVTASYAVNNNTKYGASDGNIQLILNKEMSGGRLPLTWSWSGNGGTYTTSSIEAFNTPSGSYTLNIFDANSATYSYDFQVLSPEILSYTASINYSGSESSSLVISNLKGGNTPYNITASTPITDYMLTSSGFGNPTIELSGDLTNGGTASIIIQGADSGSLASASILNEGTGTFHTASYSHSYTASNIIELSSSIDFYSRAWEVSQSLCENTTSSLGSNAIRRLNFYTYTGSEWVSVRIKSGSETPIQIDTSGSATGSYVWNTNDDLLIDVITGSNDNFYVRREFSGSSDISGAAANVTGNEITNSAIITGSGRLDDFNDNLDVSLMFGTSHSLKTLSITASKVNTEVTQSNINFKFVRQIPLNDIRDNFTGSVATLITTGSLGSGSNFIARNDEFTDIIFGNTGSYLGPNRELFRETYPYGNIINTVSGSSVEYTNGKIFSGSISASIFGGTNAKYLTQRTDKAFMMVADIDQISFLDVYSYTSASFYNDDPLSPRPNLSPYTHNNHTIYAGSQAMNDDLFYIMVIHKDEDAEMSLPTGINAGELFTRKLEFVNDVNRIYYLFTSPEVGPSFINNYTSSFAITVQAYTEGNRYNVDNEKTASITLRRGVSASLVQSDSSNGAHPIRLSTTENGTHGGGVSYTGSNNGISYKGTAGTNGELSINLPADAPDTLYYYCVNHSNMGGKVNVFNSSSIIQEDVDNRTIAIGKYFIDNVIYG